MSPQQLWIYNQLVTILTTNNPNASIASIQLLATELSGLWANLILPNLTVNLTTGAVSFVVPSGS